MNKKLKYLNLSLVLSLYCFALGVVMGVFSDGTQFTHSASNQESFSTSVSVNLFSASPRIDSFSSIVSGINAPNLNDDPGNLWTVFKNIERIACSSFKQYSMYSSALLVHSRKSDLFYPFHYFW